MKSISQGGWNCPRCSVARQLDSSCRSGSLNAARAVICKQEVPYKSLKDFGSDLQKLQVKEVAITSVVNSVSCISVGEYREQHSGEHEAEQVGTKTQPCFTPLDTGKGSDIELFPTT